MKRLALLLCAAFWPAAAALAGNFADRAEVKAFVAEMAEKHGFERARLLQLFRKLQPQPAAIRAILPPRDPSVRSWQAYRARYLDAERIAGGLRFWERHRAALEAARERYGVPEEIVVAVIGVETVYGSQTGRFPVLATLTSLAFDYPPRAELFRAELDAFLLLAREQRRNPLSYRGSYAGALGIPQFLPSSARHWGVDFDGDGRIDLAASAADAIGSVANFLASHGWRADEPFAAPASVSGAAHEALLVEGIAPRLTPAQMEEYGVTSPEAPQAPCALVDLATPGEPTEYRLGYGNFFALTRYNRSSFYAMAVFDLARELRVRREAKTATLY